MREEKRTYYLAIDIGATSGRAILGTLENGRFEMEEINRFPNPIIDIHGFLYWDLFHLYSEIIASLKAVKTRGIPLTSIGIDTWGVDFVSFGKDGEPLRMPYSYRDTHTFDTPEKFFTNILSKKRTYLKTGIQIMNFNSLFQLFEQRERHTSIYPVTDKFLFIPDALSYLLTGNMVTEYTIASTSQLLNPFDRTFDNDLLAELGLSEKNFAPIVFPGTLIGALSETICRLTGLDPVPVIAVAGHDTASAVIATPAENKNFAYLSSGTWSLIGIESKEPVVTEKTFALNFTNEGGADGSIRLLKNICGMWLIERCRNEWEQEKPISYEELIKETEKAPAFRSFINPDASRFTNPKSMIEAIQSYCRETGQPVPATVGEIARCIFESLAFRYRQVLADLQQLADFRIKTLHIIGGGSQNNFLNRCTANAIGMPVIAGPSEATAIGNIMMQAKAAGIVGDIKDIRKVIRDTIPLHTFIPERHDEWKAHYTDYIHHFQEK
ncbi:MAG TPA: rhamnulokinase [Porphyromonadaceae bacterium]|nr:rhamnulokinase [Porphyromonadaceae bacterium]